MSFKFDISAGGFFELIRPAVLVLSALASIWVLASARRHRFRDYIAVAWALGALFFPLVTFPLYLIARFVRQRSEQPQDGGKVRRTLSSPRAPRFRIVFPLAYAAVVLSAIGFYLYRDYQSVDGHLARATRAKVSGNRGGTIDEYRAVLKLEDNPHTRKLLGIELAETGDWTGALLELRNAEQGGESDDRLPYYIAAMLDSLNLPNQATLEYKRFLESTACTQPLPDERCAGTSARVQAMQPDSRPR